MARTSERFPSTVITRRLKLVCLSAIALIALLVAIGDNATGQNDLRPVEYLNLSTAVKYVGDEACRTCHLSQYDSFKKTGMGRSMALATPEDDLGAFSRPISLDTVDGRRVYSIFTEYGRVFHRETLYDTDGNLDYSESHPVEYRVGSGNHGRSYLIKRGDSLFLSPLSYYASAGKWDLSPGHDQGLYRGFSRPAGNLCISCHSGMPQPVAGTTNRYRHPEFRMLAIGCERCHGPGALHVTRRRGGTPIRGSRDNSIVNPGKLPIHMRDQVCYQCHLAGDARVQQPGKTILDFRPGMHLDDVVSVFFVPPNLKPDGFQALSQAEQIRMSRCKQPDGSSLNCTTCHDPHAQSSDTDARKRYPRTCVGCHDTERPSSLRAHAGASSPSDNCISCHMPKAEVTNIAHTALTDHRIRRTQNESEGAQSVPDLDMDTNLIWATRTSADQKPGRRALALAFSQLAANYPGYGARGFPLLEQVARELPNDAEVQITYGRVLLIARLSEDYRVRAKQAFERAIKAEPGSVVALRHLAQLLLEENNSRGLELLRGASKLEPYDASLYVQLARAYIELGKQDEAELSLREALRLDPGNPAARDLQQELIRSR